MTEKPNKWPTMMDVSRLSGASLKTVSRVVNGEPNVGAATMAKVLAAMDELGYRRNESASMLRRGSSTGTIALVMEDSSGPFFASIVSAVEQVARLNGFMLFTAGAEGDPARAARLAEAFLDRRVDGLVVAASMADGAQVEEVLPSSTKAVFLERPSAAAALDSVQADNQGGVRAAVEHLLEVGHQRIAFVGDDIRYFTAIHRRDGFIDAMEQADLEPGPVLMDGGVALGRTDILRDWTDGPDPVTAVVTGNNRTSRELLLALRNQQDLDLGHVCFDEMEMADLLRPAVTTVSQDAAEMGRQAAELLLSRIGGNDGPAQHLVVPTKLTVRESGANGVPRLTESARAH